MTNQIQDDNEDKMKLGEVNIQVEGEAGILRYSRERTDNLLPAEGEEKECVPGLVDVAQRARDNSMSVLKIGDGLVDRLITRPP